MRGDAIMLEDSEGEMPLPDPSCVIESNVLDVEGLEGNPRTGAVSTLSWVTVLVTREHDITACGVGTEFGIFFRLFV